MISAFLCNEKKLIGFVLIPPRNSLPQMLTQCQSAAVKKVI